MEAWFDDLPLDFSREDTRAAEAALIAGYPLNMAALQLAQNAGLNMATLNQMWPVQYLMREIMVQARVANRMKLLLGEVFADPSRDAIHDSLRPLISGHEAEITEAAMRREPSLERLRLLPPTIEVWARDAAPPQPLATPGLERLINAAAGFTDAGVFRKNLAEAELRTARIEVGGKAKGTGFLVSDRLLLTNWHVVSGVTDNAVARFDHSVLNSSLGRVVGFAEDWRVAHSPHQSAEVELGAAGPPQGDWDFALVRLDEPVGAQAIGADPGAAQVDRRGGYRLDGSSYIYDADEPLLIVGHPKGRPVQLSYAAPSGARSTEHANRVRYQTNTEGGSSGSPVFNRDFRVVALHHAGGPTSDPDPLTVSDGRFNQGVPIAGIVDELKRQLKGRPELAELGLPDPLIIPSEADGAGATRPKATARRNRPVEAAEASDAGPPATPDANPKAGLERSSDVGTDGERSGGANVLRFPTPSSKGGNASTTPGSRVARGGRRQSTASEPWVDLVQILHDVAFDATNWRTLAVSTEHLRTQLARPRPQRSTSHTQASRLLEELDRTLRVVLRPSATKAQIRAACAQAERLRSWLLDLLE